MDALFVFDALACFAMLATVIAGEISLRRIK